MQTSSTAAVLDQDDAFDLDLEIISEREAFDDIRMGECGTMTTSCMTGTTGYCTCTIGTCARTCGGVTGVPCAC